MSETEKRKDQHIVINLKEDVQSDLNNGFDLYSFQHQALPELNLAEISTETVFLGKQIALPLMISSMTGGTETGDRINHVLAEAAQITNIALGIGSQRAQLEKGGITYTHSLRKVAGQAPLYANIGAVQLNYGFTVSDCQRAVDMLEADALILHLNPLQEALQAEGQTNFSGLAKKIGNVCHCLQIPVIVKEVGWGISLHSAKILVDQGVAAIDVAGAGGTSWSEVEKYRSKNEIYYRVASKFRDWGNTTAEAVREIHAELPETPLIASGGLRNGVEIAKAMAMGSNIAGIAGPFLKAANVSTDAVTALIEEIQLELRVTMFAAGAANIMELSQTPLKKTNR